MDKVVTITNLFILNGSLLVLDFTLAAINSEKRKCVKYFLLTGQDYGNVNLLNFLPIPKVFGITVTKPRLFRGCWIFATGLYTLMNVVKLYT